ncbi:acetate kinase [bacterium]|nr:acetate kinase [bacterium]
MVILILNSGSSSVKYQLWDTKSTGMLAKGLVSRIGIDNPKLEHRAGDKKYDYCPDGKIDHNDAVKLALDALVDSEHGIIENIEQIDAVGHRVVHGGEKFAESALITDDVIDAVKECIPLAPLHNPPNLMGIEACQKLMPNIPQVAVFDTAFHQTMEPYAFIYALPYDLYKTQKIRRYGFHGTSHYYVAHRAAEFLGKPIEKLKIITAHLGNGASMTAVKNGKSVDTSMGFTPLEGLVMGTRTGDMDPAIVMFVMEHMNMTPADANNFFNKKSGILGISGKSNDIRDVIEASESGDMQAKLALDVYTYRIRKYIGAYAAAMGGLDTLVFTAGAGENSPFIRRKIIRNLEFLGIKIDEQKNESAIGITMDISTDDASVRTLVVPTNEELVIANETEQIVSEI